MSKIGKVEEEVRKTLEKGCACYVLICCSEPDASGKMQVEMQYDGDEMLAAFLIENAGQMFDNGLDDRRESK